MTEQTFLVIEEGDCVHRIVSTWLNKTTRLLLVLSGDLRPARDQLIAAVEAAVKAYDDDCHAYRRSL